MRTYLGKPPTTSHAAQLIASATIAGKPWELWQYWHRDKPMHESHDYYKVICLKRQRKANFWLAWDTERELWLYRTGGYARLLEHYPDAAAWCEMVTRDGAEVAALIYGK